MADCNSMWKIAGAIGALSTAIVMIYTIVGGISDITAELRTNRQRIELLEMRDQAAVKELSDRVKDLDSHGSRTLAVTEEHVRYLEEQVRVLQETLGSHNQTMIDGAKRR